MDIVKVIAVLIIIFVIGFGAVLLVQTSKLEKEIQEEIGGRQQGKKVPEGEDDEV